MGIGREGDDLFNKWTDTFSPFETVFFTTACAINFNSYYSSD